jgi:hypothetical protein
MTATSCAGGSSVGTTATTSNSSSNQRNHTNIATATDSSASFLLLVRWTVHAISMIWALAACKKEDGPFSAYRRFLSQNNYLVLPSSPPPLSGHLGYARLRFFAMHSLDVLRRWTGGWTASLHRRSLASRTAQEDKEADCLRDDDWWNTQPKHELYQHRGACLCEALQFHVRLDALRL